MQFRHRTGSWQPDRLALGSAVGLLLALTVLLPATALAEAPEWVNITGNLTGSLEGYSHEIPGARGVGGLAVDRHSGDLLAGLNGPPWGLYRSSDGGKSWTRLDEGEVAGGWTRPFSLQVDPNRPGRIAAFRVGPPGPAHNKPRSACTIDAGKTWHEIDRPKALGGLAGWRHGMVDWSDETPKHMIAQPRVRPDLSVSHDGGKRFEALKTEIAGIQQPDCNIEYIKAYEPQSYQRFVDHHVLGYGIAQGAVLLGDFDGMKRSTDDGETFQKTADFLVAAYTPVLFDGKLYWGGEQGMLVSDDAGKTWSLQGAKLPMIRQGPLFGSDADEMVVVTEDGVYRTTDGAKTWKKLCDLYRDPTAWRSELGPAWLRHSYAWDHRRNTLYLAGMAGSIWKLEVPE